MLSDKLLANLNEQIKFELYSSNLYLAMAAYCAAQNLDGFANFYIVQANEERGHAMKFFDFIREKRGRLQLTALDEPQNDFKSVADTVEISFKHEQFVTKRIDELMNHAIEEKEHATVSFLKWFVDEQVEEESNFDELLTNVRRVADSGSGLLMLDGILAGRTSGPEE